VHGTGRGAGGRGEDAGDDGPRVPGAGDGQADGAGEDPGLLDRLAGAGADQGGRPVRGEREQGHTGVARLQHRGVQVRHRRARRRRDRDGASRAQGETESEEPGRALVDADVQPQPAVDVGLVQREGERRVARTRAEHGLGDPAPGQLVDDSPGELDRRHHTTTVAARRDPSPVVIVVTPGKGRSALR
jgi:hypothetical protein